jgi:hypothetical protein
LSQRQSTGSREGHKVAVEAPLPVAELEQWRLTQELWRLTLEVYRLVLKLWRLIFEPKSLY